MKRRDVLALAGGAASSIAMPAIVRAQTAPLRVSVANADAYAEGYFAADQGVFRPSATQLHALDGRLGRKCRNDGGGQRARHRHLQHRQPRALDHARRTIQDHRRRRTFTASRPTTAVVTGIDSPVKSVKDLAGKVVAVTALKDLTEVGVRVWLDRNGVDSRSVKFVETPMGLMTAALGRGTFDAALVGEPYLSDGVGKTMRVIGDAYATIAPQFLIANWFTTTDFLKANLPLVKRFVAAIYDTARWANAHEAEAGANLNKYAKMDPATLTRMTRCIYATSLEPRYLDSVLSVMYKYGALDKRLTSGDLVANLA